MIFISYYYIILINNYQGKKSNQILFDFVSVVSIILFASLNRLTFGRIEFFIFIFGDISFYDFIYLLFKLKFFCGKNKN